MKNLVKLLAVAVAISATSIASAQKIATVAIELAILQTDKAQEVIKKNSEENAVFKDKVSQYEALAAELKDLTEKYKRDEAVLSAEQKNAQVQLIQSKENEAMTIQKQLRNVTAQIREALVRNNAQLAVKTARDVAEAEGIDVLLNAQSVLYMKTANDITPKVTDALNKTANK